MRSYRGFAAPILGAVTLALIATALAACQPAAPPTESEAPAPGAEVRNEPWFICDALNLPRILVAARSADHTRALITEYEKPGGLPLLRAEYDLTPPLVNADLAETPLTRDGVPPGRVRELVPAAMDNPGAAYTPPVRSVVIGDRSFDCRWLPRTRFIGFSERRSYVVHEDADGDLIYTAFDFEDPQPTPIELSEDGLSTPFSIEVRGGREVTGPGGSEFRFENADHLYLAVARTEGFANVEVWRGETQRLNESMLAHQLATGPAD